MRAQSPPAPAGPALLKVFLDCDECDSDHLKRTVTFVDYVRDRNVADVHVLVTTQGTGGGGEAWTVKFIGVGQFQSQDRTLTFTTTSISTADDRRREFARVFKLGIVGYAASLSTTAQLDVTSVAKTASETTPTRDRWNFWVFEAGGGGSLNGQSLDKSSSYYGNVSASRTTEAWKVNISASRNENRSEFVVKAAGAAAPITSVLVPGAKVFCWPVTAVRVPEPLLASQLVARRTANAGPVPQRPPVLPVVVVAVSIPPVRLSVDPAARVTFPRPNVAMELILRARRTLSSVSPAMRLAAAKFWVPR